MEPGTPVDIIKTQVRRWSWEVDHKLPMFTVDRGYIGRHLTDVFWKEEVPSEDDI